MSDTFGDLLGELAARGTDYLEPGRAERFLNRGYQMLCEEYPFDFLKKTVTAQAAPLTISDLREIVYVADATSNSELFELDERQVSELDPDSNETGTASYWYLLGDTLYTYPTDTAASLIVRYVRVPTELSGAADEPLVPQRYRNLIVDAAYYLALKDNDEFDSAAALKALYDAEVLKMILRLGNRSLQAPRQVA